MRNLNLPPLVRASGRTDTDVALRHQAKVQRFARMPFVTTSFASVLTLK